MQRRAWLQPRRPAVLHEQHYHSGQTTHAADEKVAAQRAWGVDDEKAWELQCKVLALLKPLRTLADVIARHIRRANLLRDAARLTVLHVGAPHVVQDLSFPCTSGHRHLSRLSCANTCLVASMEKSSSTTQDSLPSHHACTCSSSHQRKRRRFNPQQEGVPVSTCPRMQQIGDRSSSRLPASLAFLTRSSRAARTSAIRRSRASSLSVSLS